MSVRFRQQGLDVPKYLQEQVLPIFGNIPFAHPISSVHDFYVREEDVDRLIQAIEQHKDQITAFLKASKTTSSP